MIRSGLYTFASVASTTRYDSGRCWCEMLTGSLATSSMEKIRKSSFSSFFFFFPSPPPPPFGVLFTFFRWHCWQFQLRCELATGFHIDWSPHNQTNEARRHVAQQTYHHNYFIIRLFQSHLVEWYVAPGSQEEKEGRERSLINRDLEKKWKWNGKKRDVSQNSEDLRFE